MESLVWGMPGILMASVFRMERSPPKLLLGLAPPLHTPRVTSLQSLEQREVGLKLLWSATSFKHHGCDQYLHQKNANVDFHVPLDSLH